MKIFSKQQILAALDDNAALAAVEEAFRRFSAGEAQVAAVGHLGFPDMRGDCHVKAAHIHGDDEFVVKLATGFYGNPALGLPSSNGFMAVMSAKTGETLAILHDEGALTDLRTALAGAIAARAIARNGSKVLGVVGSGIQARMQAQQIQRLLGLKQVLVWSRRPKSASMLAADLQGEALSLTELCARADVIVTTTPSTAPIILNDMIHDGTRIVAVGADSPGKQELETALVARSRIVVDSRAQCVDHGEAGWAVRAGLTQPAALVELGELLNAPIHFAEEDVVVADLTGVAIQDVAIARSVWLRLHT